jgi:hypothetical protein
MAKQFPHVSGKYGAPMGRSSSPLSDAPRTVRVFRVRLDSGGYDDGGAYWGHGQPIYCAEGIEGGRQFVRADSRLQAIAELSIPAQSLKTTKGWQWLIDCQSRGLVNARGLALRASLEQLGFGG